MTFPCKRALKTMKWLLFPRTKNLPVLGLDVRRKSELPRTQDEIWPHCKGAGRAEAACATDVSTKYQLVQLLHAFWWALRWHTGKVWVWRICTSLVTLPWLIELARLIFSSTASFPSVSSKTLQSRLEVFLDFLNKRGTSYPCVSHGLVHLFPN